MSVGFLYKNIPTGLTVPALHVSKCGEIKLVASDASRITKALFLLMG